MKMNSSSNGEAVPRGLQRVSKAGLVSQAAEAAHAEVLRQQESQMQALQMQLAAYEEQLEQWQLKTATAEEQLQVLSCLSRAPTKWSQSMDVCNTPAHVTPFL